jgi:predicted ATPase/DNA-binding XRE family transcriptional regulator
MIPTKTDTSFAALLRQTRIARDLTQEALAEIVGCATQTIRSFEIGRRRPSREMAARLADVLQVPPAEREALLRLARAPLAAPAPGAELAPAPADAPAGPRARPALSLAPGTLIGRQAELARLRQALLFDGRRLVTLLGPGGIGKTRLALQCAAGLAGQFADGAAFVALAPVADTANLVTAVAEALGCPLSGAPRPEAALRDFLRDRELLLVLDNLEQLLVPGQGEQLGALLADMLGASPGLRLLATSRERLRLRDETVVELDGLAVPSARAETSDAALLFAERARQASDDFTLSPQNRGAVARICRLLGGVPLAIELAASWVRALSPDEIAAEVARSLDFLSVSSRDLPARHRSLRAVLDHSWQLLAPDERRLLALMSVFCGGARREAIGAVLGPGAGGPATLALLAALIDKSLVRRSKDADGATRYDLHELVRQYAATRLAEQPGGAGEADARHAAFYASWLAEQEPALKSARQKAAVAAIVGEIANVRAAWGWACAGQSAELLRAMLPTLDWFYELRGWYAEARAAFARGAQALRPLAEAPGAPELAQTCYWLMYGREGFHTLRRDPAFAVQRLRESVAMLRTVSSEGEQIHCIKGLAYVGMFAGAYADAEALLDETRALAVARGDNWNLAMAIVIRGALEVLRGEVAAARRQLDEALPIARAVGDPRPISTALTYRGLTALALGDIAEAERTCSEAHLLAADAQDRFQMSLSLQALGRVALAKGEHDEAGWLFSEALAIAREIGDRWLEAQALGCLGALAQRAGDLAGARSQRRSAVAAAERAPAPIALDELAALALLELGESPAAALAALAYVQRHPLTRPATRAVVAGRWAEAAAQAGQPAQELALATAQSFPPERPAALLALFATP